MVLGYHIIFSTYGFWLPNDPRGSWSEFVGAWDLFRAAGKATKTDVRHSVASREHDRELRRAGKAALAKPPVKFNGVQARAVGRGFAEYVAKSGLPVWACSIMPDHVHLVTGPFRLPSENVVIQLKGAATKRLLEEKLHPFDGEHKCWAQGQWKVFLNDELAIRRAIRYVERNPVKDGLRPQQWTFVTPFSREAESAEPSAASLPRSAPRTPPRG